MRTMTVIAAIFAAGRLSAAISPMAFEGSDSDRIGLAIERSCSDGSRKVTIPSKPNGAAWLIDRAILLPSDFTLELDGCLVQLAPGTRDNLIRNAGAVEGRISPDRNITVRGRNGAILCGGVENHYAPNRSGDVNGWTTIGILLCSVDGFMIEGFTLRETQAWGISVENGCMNGRIAGIRFEDTNRMRNQDGIDVRKGCHDIVIEDVTGICGDDVVALTALRSDKPVPPGRRSMQIGGKSPTDHDDVYNVMIRNVKARCAGGHGVIRLLCQDGIRMHHVVVSNVTDTTDVGKGDKPAQAVLRIGDVNYWSMCPAKLGDMHHIMVDGIDAKGLLGVWVKGALSDSTLRNVVVPDGVRKYDITAQIENVTAL